MSDTLHDLELVLLDRQATRPPGSYSAELFADGELLRRKVMEEAFEVCLELGRAPDDLDRGRVAEEAADLLYHLLVGLVSVGVPLTDVLAELERRR